jgi:hypothetical protein
MTRRQLSASFVPRSSRLLTGDRKGRSTDMDPGSDYPDHSGIDRPIVIAVARSPASSTIVLDVRQILRTADRAARRLA